MANSWASWWSSFFLGNEDHQALRDNNVRGILLVIVTLIAAVTFQAGINPPGGVWQDDLALNPNGAVAPAPSYAQLLVQGDARKGHRAGQVVYASQEFAFNVFLLANTLGFSMSILVMWSLAQKFPFEIEIFIATVAMIVTYWVGGICSHTQYGGEAPGCVGSWIAAGGRKDLSADVRLV